jgi:hypothetical protein
LDARLSEGVLSLTAAVIFEGEYDVCSGGVSLATVVAKPSSDCAFSVNAAPCSSSACAEDPSSDACRQVAAAYCAYNPQDLGCKALLLRFAASVGEPATVRATIAANLSSVVEVRYVDSACSEVCGPNCQDRQTEVLAATFEHGILVVDAVTFAAGQYRVCVASDGFDFVDVVHVADVDVQLVETLDAPAALPCEAKVCKLDPLGEACQSVSASYCSSHPTDAGCEYVRPAFDRVLGESSTLALPLAVRTTRVAALVVPARCTCGVPCESLAAMDVVVLMATQTPETQFLKVEVVPYAKGNYRVCVAPLGASSSDVEDFPEDVADLTVRVAGGSEEYLYRALGSPCSAEQCADDPESDECQQVASAYCQSDSDWGCTQLVPRFRVNVNEQVTLTVYAALGIVSPDATVINARCECGDMTCGEKEVQVWDTEYHGDSQILSITLQAYKTGEYRMS